MVQSNFARLEVGIVAPKAIAQEECAEFMLDRKVDNAKKTEDSENRKPGSKTKSNH